MTNRLAPANHAVTINETITYALWALNKTPHCLSVNQATIMSIITTRRSESVSWGGVVQEETTTTTNNKHNNF